MFMKNQLKEQIINDLEKFANTGKSEVRAYLTDTGSMRDSAAQLASVTIGPYHYPAAEVGEMALYRQQIGWDQFICRCAVVVALGFRGRWLYKLVYEDQDFSGMAQALLGTDLPLTTVLDVFGALYASYYPCDTCIGVRVMRNLKFVRLSAVLLGLVVLRTKAQNGFCPMCTKECCIVLTNAQILDFS